MQTMESRPVVPDRKLLARLVLIREEARNMMGGGILDERNDRGLRTLPVAEVCMHFFQILNTSDFYMLFGSFNGNMQPKISRYVLAYGF